MSSVLKSSFSEQEASPMTRKEKTNIGNLGRILINGEVGSWYKSRLIRGGGKFTYKKRGIIAPRLKRFQPVIIALQGFEQCQSSCRSRFCLHRAHHRLRRRLRFDRERFPLLPHRTAPSLFHSRDRYWKGSPCPCT